MLSSAGTASGWYVTNEVAQTVSVIDTATNAVVNTINVVWPSSLALSPDGESLYVLAQPSQSARYVFSTTTNVLESTVPLVGVTSARGMAVTPDGTRFNVSTYTSPTASVKVIDTALLSIVATVPVGAVALGVDITPDGSRVDVANLNSNTVSAISTATNTVVATVPVPNRPGTAPV